MSVQSIRFTGEADFEAFNEAKKWCDDNGYSYGALQADAPTGLLKGSFEIAKWRNLTGFQIKALDGSMHAPGRSYRTGPVTIMLKDEREKR